jgi:hypothetical protein
MGNAKTSFLHRRLNALDPAEIDSLIVALPVLERLATDDTSS